MEAVRHHGFAVRMFEPPANSIITVQNLFRTDYMQMQLVKYCVFGLKIKCLLTRPFYKRFTTYMQKGTITSLQPLIVKLAQKCDIWPSVKTDTVTKSHSQTRFSRVHRAARDESM